MGQLIITRPARFLFFAVSTKVVVNGQIVCKVKNGETKNLKIASGLHEIGLRLAYGAMTKTVAVHIAEGQKQHLEIGPTSLYLNRHLSVLLPLSVMGYLCLFLMFNSDEFFWALTSFIFIIPSCALAIKWNKLMMEVVRK